MAEQKHLGNSQTCHLLDEEKSTGLLPRLLNEQGANLSFPQVLGLYFAGLFHYGWLYKSSPGAWQRYILSFLSFYYYTYLKPIWLERWSVYPKKFSHGLRSAGAVNQIDVTRQQMIWDWAAVPSVGNYYPTNTLIRLILLICCYLIVETWCQQYMTSPTPNIPTIDATSVPPPPSGKYIFPTPQAESMRTPIVSSP